MANKPRVHQYSPDDITSFPVSGGGTALVDGAMLIGPDTSGNAATQNGHLQLGTGTSALALGAIGILRGPHTVAQDVDVAGTVFTTSPVDLITPIRTLRMEYDQTSQITCTQAVTTTTMTVTSLEDNIDAAFLYVVSGTGAGQTNYLTASASGSCTLKAAFATSLDTTSKFIKILPRFNRVAGLTADGTALTSQAGAGAVAVVIMDTFIIRNNREDQMDPTKHAALTGLNSLASVRFEANVSFRDTIVYSVA